MNRWLEPVAVIALSLARGSAVVAFIYVAPYVFAVMR